MATLVLFTLAALAALAPIPPAWVERAYASGLYRAIQPPLTSASNMVPFALFDAAMGGVAIAWVWAASRDVRHAGWGRASVRAVLRTLRWSALAYLAFLLLWGLNYRRQPLTDKLQFDRGAVTADAARRIARLTVDRVNTLAAPAHAMGWRAIADPDSDLEDGLRAALRALGVAAPVVGRPKRTVLDFYFRRAGVEGMTDPFFLETLVVTDLLPFERPLVIAHEWSHLAGIVDEGEANFAGWLACLRGSPADQYSGWLFLYEELAGAVERTDRAPLAAALGPVPRADLAAVRERARRNVQPAVSDAAWRAYDSYLKTNRVAAGTRSYAQVVQLVLGVRFDERWTPARR